MVSGHIIPITISWHTLNLVLTRENCLNVPGQHTIDERVHVEHHNGSDKVVGVSLHWAGVHVEPLDSNSLFFILGEVLTAKAKRHRRQKALEKT